MTCDGLPSQIVVSVALMTGFPVVATGREWRCRSGRDRSTAAGRGRPRAVERAAAERETAALAVQEPAAKRARDRAKRERFPGNVFLTEQLDLETFAARPEIQVEQARAIHHVHLMDV